MSNILDDVKENLVLLHNLVRNDLKSRYSGSAFGILWAFIQPLVTVLVFWFVFQLGFRNSPVGDVEYILWLIAGYIPWTFFNDSIMASSNVMYEYSYLVKKMKFKVWMLPIIKIFSSLYIHLFFVLFVWGMYILYGYAPQWVWISVLYYSFCTIMLLIGMAFLLSSLAVFLKDMTQMVAIALQLGFWMTPIFWSDASMKGTILKILQLNPLYYVLSGWRDVLIKGIGFWEQPVQATLYFWGFSFVVLIIGIKVYRTLRVHFADLL